MGDYLSHFLHEMFGAEFFYTDLLTLSVEMANTAVVAITVIDDTTVYIGKEPSSCSISCLMK
jgi:hypothetical protein